jgi:hypothetical protein
LKVWQIEWGAGALPLRGGEAPTPPFATFTIQIGIRKCNRVCATNA